MRAPALRLLVTLLPGALTAQAGDVPPAADDPRAVVAYENGLWFDGLDFRAGTFYVQDGVLRRAAPGPVGLRVDLRGRHVVPPFGEAHNHLLEPARVVEYDDLFLSQGVFYVKDQGNVASLFEELVPYFARPDTIDVVSAKLGLTGPGGHPLEVLGQLQGIGALPSWPADEIDGQALFLIEDAADLDRSWPRLLETRPDFVKVFLLYSEEYERRRDDPAYLYRRGLDPTLVPEVVERAHAAGLSVSAHVYTAHDFRVAVEAGVELIAHLPGTGYEPELGPEAFRLTDADAELAAARGTSVVTTLSWLREDLERSPAAARAMLDGFLLPNLAVLRDHGVPLLVGSDAFRGTSAEEALFLAELEALSPLELLVALCETTPRAIFPGRAIGRLRDGCEASFVVLDGDPVEDLANIRRIALRVKQGHVLLPRGDPIGGGGGR